MAKDRIVQHLGPIALGLAWLLIIGAIVVEMAFGAAVVTEIYGGAVSVNVPLLTAATADTDGQWFDVGGLTNASVEVAILGTANVTLHGSNAPTQPANSEHGRTLSNGAVTQSVMLYLGNNSTKWVKCRITGASAATVNCWFQGSYPKSAGSSGTVQVIGR